MIVIVPAGVVPCCIVLHMFVCCAIGEIKSLCINDLRRAALHHARRCARQDHPHPDHAEKHPRCLAYPYTLPDTHAVLPKNFNIKLLRPLAHPNIKCLPKNFYRPANALALTTNACNDTRIAHTDFSAMARAASQNNPVTPYKAAAPTGFDEQLAVRAFPHRFRRIGSPYAYLNDIGIEAILEYIIKGHLLIEVAEETNVPFRILQKWVAEEGHFDSVDDAETQSAEGVMAQARKAVRDAPTEFELRRAKVLLAHAEWMATKKNKATYGETKNDKNAGGGVHYTFNINGSTTDLGAARDVIEAVAVRQEQPKVMLDMAKMFSGDTPQAPFPPGLGVKMPVLDVPEGAEEGPQLRLVADRPANPTPQNPDIGPFFEEIDE